jgi:hypothetical protein
MTPVPTVAIVVELLARSDTAQKTADALASHGDWLALALTFAPTCEPALLSRLAPQPGLERALARRRLDATRCDDLRPRVATAARAFK